MATEIFFSGNSFLGRNNLLQYISLSCGDKETFVHSQSPIQFVALYKRCKGPIWFVTKIYSASTWERNGMEDYKGHMSKKLDLCQSVIICHLSLPCCNFFVLSGGAKNHHKNCKCCPQLQFMMRYTSISMLMIRILKQLSQTGIVIATVMRWALGSPCRMAQNAMVYSMN